MTALDASNVFNVHATLNQWLSDTLGAFDLPSWLTSYTLVTLAPETELPTPSFSVNFIDVGMMMPWMGDDGAGKTSSLNKGIMEVNAWVSRSGPHWMAQLRTMQGMVAQAVNGARAGIVLKDYATPGAPIPTNYLIRLEAMEAVSTQPDPNPDIERIRMLINYRWVLRS